MSTQATPGSAGWFSDPAGRFESRYWDGSRWTDAVMRGGEVESDPAPIASATEGAGVRSGAASGAMDAVKTGSAIPPAPTDRSTSLSAVDAQTRVAHALAMSGFALKASVPGRLDAELEVKGEPNWIVVVLLLFLWIIPAVIYWYMKSRPVTHSVTLHFVPEPVGTRIAIQAPDGISERLAPVLAPLPW